MEEGCCYCFGTAFFCKFHNFSENLTLLCFFGMSTPCFLFLFTLLWIYVLVSQQNNETVGSKSQVNPFVLSTDRQEIQEENDTADSTGWDLDPQFDSFYGLSMYTLRIRLWSGRIDQMLAFRFLSFHNDIQATQWQGFKHPQHSPGNSLGWMPFSLFDSS